MQDLTVEKKQDSNKKASKTTKEKQGYNSLQHEASQFVQTPARDGLASPSRSSFRSNSSSKKASYNRHGSNQWGDTTSVLSVVHEHNGENLSVINAGRTSKAGFNKRVAGHAMPLSNIPKGQRQFMDLHHHHGVMNPDDPFSHTRTSMMLGGTLANADGWAVR